MRAAQSMRRFRSLLKKHLAVFIYIVFAIQPMMDVLSYWQDQRGGSALLTLVLRMAVLVAVTIAGFLLSKRRRYYWYLAVVCGVFYVLHALACAYAGFVSPFADLTNYIRVVQIPLFTLCFISFCRADKRAFRWIRTGILISFAIITVVVLLSVITGSNPHTYQDTQSGVLGWFSTTNSQAAILSMVTPVLLCMAYRAKNPAIFVITAVLACGQLYLLGTRLAYMAVFASLFGLMLVAGLCGKAEKTRYITMIVIAVLCLAGYKVSPMYEHQMSYAKEMQEKQEDLSAMSEQRGTDLSELTEEEQEERTDLEQMRSLNQIYVYYCSDLVQRFGLEYVMEQCDFKTDVTAITGVRRNKIMFCSLLMDEEPFPSRLFGLEREKMEFKGEQYDVENDFHGIYFLYGIVGLLLFLAFVLYFVYLIGKALCKNAAMYFTMDAGAFGISFILMLLNAYATAGIFRRPNASFYMSVILAVIYYLVNIRQYPEGKINAALPPFLKKHFPKRKNTVE